MTGLGRREELITKLATTLHLSVPERQEFNPTYVLRDEIAAVIRAELAAHAWHPRRWRPHTPGNIVWEGYAIEAVEGGGFRVHKQASFAIEPKRLRGSKTLDFASLDEAIDCYLKEEFPSGSIDGIRLAPTSSRQS